MNIKKRVILELLVLLLLVVTVFVGCGGNTMRPEKALNSFSKLIEKENLDDIRLTIYYLSPFILTPAPLSVDDLVYDLLDGSAEESDGEEMGYKIVVSADKLEEHINLLRQISNATLKPVEQKSRINARINYVFENKKGRKIFDVAMWGRNDSIFINGLEVEGNPIFYDILMPFLPEEEATGLEKLIAKIFSNNE